MQSGFGKDLPKKGLWKRHLGFGKDPNGEGKLPSLVHKMALEKAIMYIVLALQFSCDVKRN